MVHIPAVLAGLRLVNLTKCYFDMNIGMADRGPSPPVALSKAPTLPTGQLASAGMFATVDPSMGSEITASVSQHFRGARGSPTLTRHFISKHYQRKKRKRRWNYSADKNGKSGLRGFKRKKRSKRRSGRSSERSCKSVVSYWANQRNGGREECALSPIDLPLPSTY